MEINLSTWSINNAIADLETMRDAIEIAAEDTVAILVEQGIGEATYLNDMAPQSGLEKSKVVGGVLENGKAGYIALTGDSAVYDEFGTGTQGERNPHPVKGNFNLKPYNSGPTIFYNQFTGTYQWRFRPMAGRPYFTNDGLTEGIPSGKQMYNTSKYLRSAKDKVIKKQFQGAIEIFK